MALTVKKKKEIVDKFKRGDNDTGSAEVQIALCTERIQYLTDHFKTHKKDHHSRQGLLTLVNKRRRLLDYLNSENPERYKKIIKELKIRK